MNHTLQLNGRHYLLRQQQNKLLLLSHPELTLLHNYYIFSSFSTTNPSTNQIMTIYQNEVTVLKIVVAPLQIATLQQSFIDWEPQGGILMQHQTVLYNQHRIVFYNRNTMLEKHWEVEVIQTIQNVKGCPGDQTVAMKVKDPGNSLFLWSMLEPSVKPAQEIILTEPILQWEFIRNDLLLILTSEQIRAYIKSDQGQFNLYHFYLLSGRSFCWVEHPWMARGNRLSVSSVVVMEGQGKAKVLQLFGVERRVLQSDMQIIGTVQLKYKTVNMKRVVGCWQERKSIFMVCETKHGELFTLELSKRLQIVSSKAHQEILGAEINDFYAKGDLVLVRDRTRWKYYRITAAGSYQLLQQIDCDKAFIGTDSTLFYLQEQALYIQTVGGPASEPIPFKYPTPDKVHHLISHDNATYLIAGIRCFKIAEGTVSSAGFSLRNERAELIRVDPLNQYLTYKMADQNMLLSFKVQNQKIGSALVKSSNKQLIGLSGGRWMTQDINQLVLGQGDKEFCTFAISKLLKILDSEEKNLAYSIRGIPGDGVILQMRNYIFFLQIVDSEKGAQLSLVKRMNTLLYHRFDPYAHSIKLVDPERLTFWVGNKVKSLGSRVNPSALLDPYSPPETLRSKQLQLRRLFPPHHPRVLELLIQTHNLTLCLETLKVVRKWFSQEQHTFEDLYKMITVDFVTEVLANSREEDLSRWGEQKKQEEAQFLHTFAAEVLENMEAIQLREKSPFNFESIISAFEYYINNNKIVDAFSQVPLILSKSSFLKGKALSSMHIAHLLHSLNKEEAAKELKPEKVSWDWLRDGSVPFWIGNNQTLKQWIEQIAMQEYRNKKEPFDCLFWYVLAGKTSLVATLFKKHKMDSKQHDAIANFLQRDFSEPKNRSAAIKNAYVLIDKKRYLHALAFFMLGGSIEDCIRLGADRLKDLNLTYTFTLFFKEANTSYLFEEMRKGDAWMKHISYKIAGEHIKSYNCLFEETDYRGWNYNPPLTGFHPQLLNFAEKVKNSVAVKRELDEQNQPSQASRDIFADFYGGQEEKVEEAPKEKLFLMGEVDELIPHAIDFYIKEGVPLMAITLEQSNQQASEAYALQLYKLGGKVPSQLQPTVIALEDTLGAVKCFISTGNYSELVKYLHAQIDKFNSTLKKVHLVEIIKTRKQVLGQILAFSYCSQQIVMDLVQHPDFGQQKQQIFKTKLELQQLSNLGCVLVCLILQNYDDLQACIEKVGNRSRTDPHPLQLWVRLKLAYGKVQEEKKSKQLKQMDHFEHAFIATYRVQKKEEIYRNDLSLMPSEAAKLMIKVCVLRHLCQKELPSHEQLVKLEADMQEYIQNWVPSNILADLLEEFRTFLREGTQAKLKLPVLGDVFGNNFNEVFDILGMIHGGYFIQSNAAAAKSEQRGDLQAIQVFRNKADGVRSFILNKHEGKGMECIVLFKKLIKKFELCQNLARRDRSKDGYGLVAEDGGYTNISHIDPNSYLKQKHPLPVDEALRHITQQRKGYGQKNFPRACTGFSQSGYIRHIQAPYMDHNELNSIECHPYLPFFLVGGKGLVEVAHLGSLRNFDRVKCPGMSEIVKLHSCGQRMGVVDNGGNFSIFNFDPSFQNNCVYSLKKASITNFCYLNPSVVAMISPTALHIIDTLIHPNRQLKFKQNFNKQPLAVAVADDNNIVVLRKHDLLIYDIRNEKLQNSKDLKGKGGRSLYVDGNLVYVGTNDSKIKLFDIYGTGEDSLNIKVGLGDDKEREKISVDQISGHDDITVAQTSEGSIYYLPKVDRGILRS